MILQLPFKTFGYFKEKPVEILLNIGTLEDMCERLGIEFYEIGDLLQDSNIDFVTQLLYYGYLTACQKSYKKPKYNKVHAQYWASHMSAESKEGFAKLLTELLGKAKKIAEADSKKKAP